MIREQKNKFWLTLILILSLSFSAFALAIANVFNNRKTNPTLHVEAASNNYVEDKVAIDVDDKDNDDDRTEKLWVQNKEDDNDTTFEYVSKIGTIYGGTEISVETASDLNTAKSEDNSLDQSWHSALRIRVKGTDGTTPYEDTYQPYIQNGYELVGFYFYAGESKYLNKEESDTNKELFEAGEKATTEQIDPEYTGKITIKAVCKPIEYNLSLYYSEDGKTWKEKIATFNVESPLDLTTGDYNLGEIETEGKERTFSSWAILTSYVDQNNGDFIVVDNIKFGAINKDDNPAEADVFTAGDGKNYYYITSVQGYSSTKTNDWYAETKHESNFNPAIRATWSYVYNGLINNDYTFHTLPNGVDEENLIGAVSSDDVLKDNSGNVIKENADGNYKTAKLKIAGAVYGSYKYPFMTNTGTAFYYKADAENSKVSASKGNYYVYNYGYEIIGWEIYFQYDNSMIYLVVKEDNGKTYWDVDQTANNNKTNYNNVLHDTNTADLASFCERLDAYFISGYDPKTIITMKPIWESVKIDIVSNGASIGWEGSDNLITYGKDYYISDLVTAPAGQMIYAYKTKDENIIAKDHQQPAVSMPWNYVNIKQDKEKGQFVYDTGVYTLTVEPICVDNIYKITLDSDGKNLGDANNTYTLEKTQQEIDNTNQYKFAVGSKDAVDKVYITTANLTKKFDHYSRGSIEEYIENYVEAPLNEYNDAITNGTLDILRKVFTTNEGATVNGLTCTLQTGKTTDFYIYLANNKPAGDLPVFEYGHYDLIAWDNIGSNRSGNVKRAYETYKYNEDFHKSDFDSYDCYLNHAHTADCEKIRNINEEPYWAYSEMNEERVLRAHFFRKYYLLDLNTLTLREGKEQEGRYGYILIEITEEDPTITGADNKGGKFIAVYDNKNTEKMQYFDVSDFHSGINVDSISSKTEFAFTKSDLLHTDAEGDYIKLYAGCTLKITASCVDYLWTNAKVGEDTFPYLDMVGYYLSSVATTSKLPNGNAGTSWFTDVVHDNITNQSDGKHNIELDSSTIESKDCSSGSKIAINAYFAPIDYEITISLKTNGANNPFAGRVDHNNQSTTQEKATLTFNAEGDYAINVESSWAYLVEYLANAGYTLSENAFVAYDEKGNVGTNPLMTYNSSNTSQSYPFKLNSEWLINHYYLNTYNAMPNFAQTLAFDVNTELYTFNYNIQIVDENGNPLTNDNKSNYNNGTIILDGSKTASNNAIFTVNNRKNSLDLGDLTDEIAGYQYNKLSKRLIGNEFELYGANPGQDFYVIKILTCTNGEAGHTHTEDCYTNYVVLESWLDYPILGNNNYKTIYEFLLKYEHLTSGTNNDILTQSVMNQIFGFGTIVNSEDRTLTVKIKVSELYTITLKAEEYENPSYGENIDPYYGDRTTTIQNHDIGFGNYTNSGTLTTSGREFWNVTDGKDYYAIVYSYKGVENVLSSTFNEVAYGGVTYRYGGSSSKIESGKFILDESIVDPSTKNVDIYVTYIPKPIETFNVTYQLNGVENSTIVAKNGSTNIAGKLIQELSNTSNISLYFGQSINYQYILLNEEGYKVSVTLNGTPVSANEVFKMVNGALINVNQIVCQVTENVYNSGGFFLIVNVIPIQKENATIMYVLDDSTKAFADDAYGKMELFVNTTNVTSAPTNGMYVVSVAEGKTLSVDISKMAKGYSFVSLKRASTVLTTTLPANNKLIITDSFSFEENNTYFIVIKKETIRATLTLDGVDNDYVGYYNITTVNGSVTINGNTKSVDAYLGKTLEFTNVDKDREVLNYYYYTDKDGNEPEIKPDGNGELTLTLTSEILEQLGDKVDGVYNINFGVKTTKKYKLTYNIVNEIYAEPVELTVVDGGETYLNGTYLLDGTKINVNVVAKDINPDSVTASGVAKYIIKFSGCDIEDADGNVLTDANKEIEFINGVAVGFVVLNVDKELTITITPKTYSTTNNEYIYNDIDSYNSLTPELTTENIGRFTIIGNANYGNTVTARFNRVNKPKGELAVVRLRGNDSSNLIVHIREKQITSIYDTTNNVEYVVNTDNAKHSLVEDIKIEEIANLKDKLQEFGYNFNINNNDIVEISYVVKNLINIKTEYLCYKTIKPII